jgi:hypothetical protein
MYENARMPDHQIFCNKARDFYRRRSGSAIVEFAIAFPIIIGLTMGIVEIGHISFANATLEGAVREASRRGVTGFVPVDGSRESYVRSRVLDMMENFTLIGPVVIETKVYESFADIGKPEPFSDDNANGVYDSGECFTDINQNGQWDADMGAVGLGGSGAIVVYDARVQLKLITPAFAFMTGSDKGAIGLQASTAVRNEPYNLLEEDSSTGGAILCS